MSTENTEPEVDVEEIDQPETTGVEQTDPPEREPDEETEDEPDVFPRAYVEQLRKEAGDARVKAKDRDDLARSLHTSLVAATGRLADPTDLDFDEAHLSDPDALTAALDDLLDRKPHLASRRPRGDVGQGVSGPSDTVDLAGILRSRA